MTDEPDFLDDLERLKVADANAKERMPPAEPAGPKALGGFFDGILPKGVAPALLPSEPECVRCGKAGVEKITNTDTGRVVLLATCERCTAIEFSERWKARVAAATKDNDGVRLARLLREKAAWVAKGRAFVE